MEEQSFQFRKRLLKSPEKGESFGEFKQTNKQKIGDQHGSCFESEGEKLVTVGFC